MDGQDWDITDDDDDAYIEGEVDENNFPPEPTSLKWVPEAWNYLRQAYISDSRATRYRRQKAESERLQEVSHHYSLKDLFQRQQKFNAAKKQGIAPQLAKLKPRKSVIQSLKEATRLKAAEELKRLVESSTEQTKKYGYVLSKKGDFYCRHMLVLNFLWV